ncbi:MULTISPECIES: YggT family protein [unclassified Frankia]|uniref:YggT family protein n=1 Tax=unclassified Frankia TaxID=2632575 RepID=UPI002AD31F4A|nr:MULTISPECIES: YggT family protein [unclassified Frankia]
MLLVYLLLMIARAVIDLVLSMSHTFRPAGVLVLVFESVYTVTDPPLRFVRRFIPLLRVGSVAFDLGFLLILIVIMVLRRLADGL